MEETEEGHHDALAKGSIQGPESRAEGDGLYLAGRGPRPFPEEVTCEPGLGGRVGLGCRGG